VDSKLVEITPELAQELLNLPHHNRNLRPRHVGMLAADMSAGDWKDGSVILLADTPDGRVLIDGQHRMTAVVKAGITITMVVISGLTLDDQEAIDTGKRRSLGDVLTMMGERNASDLGTAIAFLYRRSHKDYLGHGNPTVAQSLRVLRENPAIRESIPRASSAARSLKISRGLTACLHYQMSLLSPADADYFWDHLESGIDLHEHDPIYLLRARLLDNATATYKKLHRVMVHALIVKAWNAYRRGDQPRVLKWTPGGATREQFPELQ
jgi:hypothetical protein